MKKLSKERKPSLKEVRVEIAKPKKDFKIEIVKVGKLEDNTTGANCSYECQPPTDDD